MSWIGRKRTKTITSQPTLVAAASEPINFTKLYDEQENVVQTITSRYNSYNPENATIQMMNDPDFIKGTFKLQILCIFGLLYPEVIKKDSLDLKFKINNFKNLMNNADKRKIIIDNLYNLNTLSQAGGMKCTRKVKKTKSKSKSKRTKHRK
jgi:hypothetical protein